MNIQELIYGISEDEFFGDCFDIELDDTSDREFTVRSKSAVGLFFGSSIVISIKLLYLDQVSVKFGDDYGNHMNLVYAVEVFDIGRFVGWLKCSLRDFVWQAGD